MTFAGADATVIYDGPTQMNAPEGLGSVTTASVVATIGGVSSNSSTVNLAPNERAVFNPGIENYDYSVNSESVRASIANRETIQLTDRLSHDRYSAGDSQYWQRIAFQHSCNCRFVFEERLVSTRSARLRSLYTRISSVSAEKA
jgi:hypothetical protein